MQPPAPQIIGRYAIHAEIASGGMASVHLARLVGPAGFPRIVAVKRAHAHLVRNDDFALMFLDEARLAARIQHPNVVTTVDVLQTADELLLVMEYVHGESLWKLARAAQSQGERVPLGIAAAILVDTLHGLHAAHEATDERGQPLHLVHRDVSPHNVLVGVDGVARLVDFGIAKATGRLHTTRDSTVKGKYAYMAPEQAKGEPVSRLSDTYAAAIIFWELLTGERLFAGKTEAETVHNCLVARARRPSLLVPELGPELDAILEKGLSRDPALRYATARDMALDIEACVPAVRPSEVGAWVQRFAGDALVERARVIAALEAAAPEELTVSSTAAVAGRAPEATRPRNRAAWAVAILAVLGLASTVTVLARSGGPASALQPSASASPSAAPAPTPEASVAAPMASSPAPSAIATTTPSALPSKDPPLRPNRVHRLGGCDPPYSIDSAGRQIFKPECMR